MWLRQPDRRPSRTTDTPSSPTEGSGITVRKRSRVLLLAGLALTGLLGSSTPAQADPVDELLLGKTAGEVRIADTDELGNDIGEEVVYALQVTGSSNTLPSGQVHASLVLAAGTLSGPGNALANAYIGGGVKRCKRMKTLVWQESYTGARRWTVEGKRYWCYDGATVVSGVPQANRLVYSDGLVYDRGLTTSDDFFYDYFQNGNGRSGHASLRVRTLQSCTGAEAYDCYANESVRIDQYVHGDGTFHVGADYEGKTTIY